MLVLMAMGARRDTRAADLSYGELRYLEIALALMTAPDVLLLDEPAAGTPHRRPTGCATSSCACARPAGRSC